MSCNSTMGFVFCVYLPYSSPFRFDIRAFVLRIALSFCYWVQILVSAIKLMIEVILLCIRLICEIIPLAM